MPASFFCSDGNPGVTVVSYPVSSKTRKIPGKDKRIPGSGSRRVGDIIPACCGPH
jgi:hypothetical protein